MSYYSLSRIGDLPDILALIECDPERVAMIDRFVTASADAALVGVLTDLRTDILAAESGGEGSIESSLSRLADAVQGIEDRPLADVQVVTDSEGQTLRLEESGAIV